MTRSDLTDFEIEEEGLKIKIKRGSKDSGSGSGSAHPFVMMPAKAEPAPIVQAAVAAAPAAAAPAAAPAAGGDEAGFSYVKSPMVGTFYRSPSPENPAFVDAGSKVDEKTVVCIIEAMKIMNEIQAEVKGSVVEVLVENGQPVEYGQRLFKIKLS